MFLKSIEMLGFKSFADRTRIEFADGISALLGPNGCGKSNVVDSIKWVLGEQATRTLRAEKMEDVIFNGTEARRAMNVAEVTLTLVNENGVLDLDVPEVSIKRRLYRSGESEYFINATPVKLKELRELFFDTGVGKSAYSIMEQGKIDQILSNKPEERRYIFEEAAGITRFKAKGHEAERKLKRTEENVVQVQNILSEVKKRHDSLKIQAEKTGKYRTIKQELFDIELDSHLVRLRRFEEEKADKEIRLEKALLEQQKLKSDIDTMNSALEENMGTINSMEHKLIEGQKNLYGIELEQENLDSRRKLHEEGLQESAGLLEVLVKKKAEYEQKLASLQEEEAGKQKQREDLEARSKDAERRIEEFTRSIEVAQEGIRRNIEQIETLGREADALEQEQLNQQERLRELTDEIVRELDKGLVASGYSWKNRKSQEEDFLERLARLSISLKGKREGLSDRVAAGGGLDSFTDDIDASLGIAIEDLEKMSGELKTYIASTPVFLDDFLSPEGFITRKRRLDEEIGGTAKNLRDRRDRIEEIRKENVEQGKAIDGYRETLEELKIGRARIQTQIKASEESLLIFQRELAGQRQLLDEQLVQIANQEKKEGEIRKQLLSLDSDRQKLRETEKTLKKELDVLQSGISDRNKDLLGKRNDLSRNSERFRKIRERCEKILLDRARIDTELKNLFDNFQENYSRDLREFLKRKDSILRNLTELKSEHSEKKAALRALGHVNLMAPEEYAEVKERYDFLNGQIRDLSQAREDLKKITTEIREESSILFKKTYLEIKKNFHVMFRQLFGGGRAELKLVDPENILESGIEILAQPPGKRLENIALLSGGERSLTAVALLFATYKVKPSPFCILDEIDAALDESNVGRFVNTLMEFGNTSQFIVITHNKKTVTGARTLLGVTMQESGISKIIAIRLGDENEENRY